MPRALLRPGTRRRLLVPGRSSHALSGRGFAGRYDTAQQVADVESRGRGATVVYGTVPYMSHWTADDVPDQSGRTAVVTGANSGIGYVTAAELARHGATVVVASRNADKGREAARRIGDGAQWRPLNLADLASVRAFAQEWEGPLDLLVNNAGVMMVPRQSTADGFELQLGTNHLGHFALTGLLLPALLAGSSPRVVTVSSGEHHKGR